MAVLLNLLSMSLLGQMRIQVLNIIGHPITFKLVGNQITFESDSEGLLDISKYDVSRFSNEVFTFEFAIVDDETVMSKNLYFNNSQNSNFISYNKITLSLLLSDKDGIFYLRLKESWLLPED